MEFNWTDIANDSISNSSIYAYQDVLSRYPVGATSTTPLTHSECYDLNNSIEKFKSINSDAEFVDFLEAINKDALKDTVKVYLPTDYQLGLTLEYIASNKSMTYSGHNEWITPIGKKVEFLLKRYN